MARREEADQGNDSDNNKAWLAARCVLHYLYKLTREDDGEYDDELLVFGRLAICNKYLEREFWHHEWLMRYNASFTHYARSRTRRRRLT
jgi:hypothetical protein